MEKQILDCKKIIGDRFSDDWLRTLVINLFIETLTGVVGGTNLADYNRLEGQIPYIFEFNGKDVPLELFIDRLVKEKFDDSIYETERVFEAVKRKLRDLFQISDDDLY